MKAFLVLAFVAVAAAEAPGYNYPSAPSQGYGAPNSYSNFGSSGNFANQQQTYRHVHIFSAPDDPTDEQARVIRVPGNNDKHVNIIFVKTPSQSASQQTELILPEQDEQKTIVYVLNRQFNADTDLKIRAPRPKQPSKPQVYFIRYKNQGNGNNNGNGNQQAASPAYGAPF